MDAHPTRKLTVFHVRFDKSVENAPHTNVSEMFTYGNERVVTLVEFGLTSSQL